MRRSALLVTYFAVFWLAVAVLLPAVSFAATPISPGELPKVDAGTPALQTILRIVFGILGAFALLGITLSGLKYITAGGNSQKTSEAKNGILLALVGLIVAVSAQALITFVVKRL